MHLLKHKPNNKFYFKLIENLPVDKEKAIPGYELANRLNLRNTRELRDHIDFLREQGYAIAAAPYKGYWLTNNPDDIEESALAIENHALSEMKTVTNLRNANLDSKKQALKKVKEIA